MMNDEMRSHKACAHCGQPAIVSMAVCQRCGQPFAERTITLSAGCRDRTASRAFRQSANPTAKDFALTGSVAAALLLGAWLMYVDSGRAAVTRSGAVASAAAVAASAQGTTSTPAPAAPPSGLFSQAQPPPLNRAPLAAGPPPAPQQEAPLTAGAAPNPTDSGSDLATGPAVQAGGSSGAFIERPSEVETPTIVITNYTGIGAGGGDTLIFAGESSGGYEMRIPPVGTASMQVPPGEYRFQLVPDDPGVLGESGDATFRKYREYDLYISSHPYFGGPLIGHIGDE